MTPLDELQFLGDPTPLPLPPFPIGTRVELDPKGMHPSDLRYYQRKAAQSLIRTSRDIVRRLRRQGFLAGRPTGPLDEHNRGRVRAVFELIAASHTIEIAGWQPSGMHVVGNIANQCYLRNGQCHSGVYYRAFLLFRANVGGNKVVYIHPEAIVHSTALRAVPVEVQET